MPANYHRPGTDYVPESRPNDKQFQIYTQNLKRPVPDKLYDINFGYAIDRLNDLDIRIGNAQIQALPGIDDALNVGKLLTLSQLNTISWVNISSDNILDESILGIKLVPQTITQRELADGGIPTSKIAQKAITTGLLDDECVNTDQLGEFAVTSDKIAPGAVTADEIADGTITATELAANSVTNPKILNLNVTTEKIADLNVTTEKMAPKAVTKEKISSNGAAIGSILTAIAGDSANWLPPATAGRILQVRTYRNSAKVLTSGNVPGTPSSFTTPFSVSITPTLPTSRIFLFASASYSLQITSTDFLSPNALKLFVNNVAFSATNEAYAYLKDNELVAFFSSLIPITNQGAGVALSLEMKGVCLSQNYYTVLGGDGAGTSPNLPYYMHAIEIDV